MWPATSEPGVKFVRWTTPPSTASSQQRAGSENIFPLSYGRARHYRLVLERTDELDHRLVADLATQLVLTFQPSSLRVCGRTYLASSLRAFKITNSVAPVSARMANQRLV